MDSSRNIVVALTVCTNYHKKKIVESTSLIHSDWIQYLYFVNISNFQIYFLGKVHIFYVF